MSDAPRKPRCGQCGSTELFLIEEATTTGEYSPDEWHIDENGTFVPDGEGWSETFPTGRWFLRCQACDHQWTRRNRKDRSL